MKYIKKYEIVDYKETDFDEIDEYDGFLYAYSDKPLTKKNFSKALIFPYNRADASDTGSEYIYQIKLNKPIYKKKRLIDMIDDEDIFSDKKDIKDEHSGYSGYFLKNYMNDWQIYIEDVNDVVSFKLVGGFVMYDKNKTSRLKIKYSEETDRWLYLYISGSLRLPKLTQNIIDELKQFRPTESIKIYKGLEEVQIVHSSEVDSPYKKGQTIKSFFNYPTSWTTNILTAIRFIDDEPSTPPFVAVMTTSPDDILVDVQMLPKKYYHTNQREIIMLPGTYEYKLVWKGK